MLFGGRGPLLLKTRRNIHTRRAILLQQVERDQSTVIFLTTDLLHSRRALETIQGDLYVILLDLANIIWRTRSITAEVTAQHPHARAQFSLKYLSFIRTM